VGRLATADPKLNAGVVFYGRVPPLEDVPKIKAQLLLNYAGKDERINADVPAFQKALDAAGVRYTLHMYEGVEHAFHNDTSAARYNAEAAQLAWKRTVEFFDRTLKSA
jgi:carboxymethylenebutenolidase